jgi:hypothetical protein
VNLDKQVLERLLAPIAGDLAAAQSDWALRTLEKAAADTRLLEVNDPEDQSQDWWDFLGTVWTAALWSGGDRLAEAIPLLRA